MRLRKNPDTGALERVFPRDEVGYAVVVQILLQHKLLRSSNISRQKDIQKSAICTRRSESGITGRDWHLVSIIPSWLVILAREIGFCFNSNQCPYCCFLSVVRSKNSRWTSCVTFKLSGVATRTCW